MQLYCCECVAMKEYTEAVTVFHGNALCIHHFAIGKHHDNPHIQEMNAADWQSQIIAGWTGSRWNAAGEEINVER